MSFASMLWRRCMGFTLVCTTICLMACGGSRGNTDDPGTNPPIDPTDLDPTPDAELCDNQKDDDGNGAIDCADVACKAYENCLGQACIGQTLTSTELPLVLTGNTTQGSSMIAQRCGGGRAPEYGYVWTVPVTGKYSIDTFASTFDTVLTILKQKCSGDLVACNDDASPQSSQGTSGVLLDAVQGDELLLLVDGRNDAKGDFTLSVRLAEGAEAGHCTDSFDNDGNGLLDCADTACARNAACPIPNCPGTFLGGVLGQQVASGVGGTGAKNLQGSCGGTGAEVTFGWTAPTDGVFTFDTNGSTLPTRLYLLNDGCLGNELVCGAASDAGQPSVTVRLVKDQNIVIVIDAEEGTGGSFSLNVWDVALPERCGDLVDNDVDGLTDCADSDCSNDAACLSPTCPNGNIASAVGPNIVSSTTEGALGLLSGSCAEGSAGKDRSYLWIAPRTGRYKLDTRGSSLSHVLYVLRQGCTGAELACETGSTWAPAEITFEAQEGTSYIFVVDEYSSWGDPTAGNFRLNLQATESGKCSDGADNDADGTIDCLDPECMTETACYPSCPEIDILSIVGTTHGTTQHRPDQRAGSCGGYYGEVSYLWTAPAAGSYNAKLTGLGSSGVLYAYHGSTCGTDFMCDSKYVGTADVQLSLDATANEQFVIVVDSDSSTAGEFDLAIALSERTACGDGLDTDGDTLIDCADPDCAGATSCCDSQDIGSAIGKPAVTGPRTGWLSVSSGSCGSSGNGVERFFQWKAPATGQYQIDTDGSNFDTTLYIRRGGCGGSEIGCDDDGGEGTRSLLKLDARAGESFSIVIDGYGTALATSTFKLNITALRVDREGAFCADGSDNDNDSRTDCADVDCVRNIACSGATCSTYVFEDLGSSLGQSMSLGSTTSTDVPTGALAGSCGGALSPEKIYRWKAPASANYAFSTLTDTQFDSVVYLLDATCKANGLPCDDNDHGTRQSQVVTRLIAGQVIFIVVDGFEGASGDFGLTIEQVSQPTEVGLCDDVVDNDNDGLTDCFDADCAAEGMCEPPVCADEVVGAIAQGILSEGTTRGGTDSFAPPCAGTGGSDVGIAWTAPSDGTFIFSTAGSSFDTVLYALYGTCTGSPIRCDDNESGSPQSEIQIEAHRGDKLVLVVDGVGRASGDYVLSVRPVR